MLAHESENVLPANTEVSLRDVSATVRWAHGRAHDLQNQHLFSFIQFSVFGKMLA